MAGKRTMNLNPWGDILDLVTSRGKRREGDSAGMLLRPLLPAEVINEITQELEDESLL